MAIVKGRIAISGYMARIGDSLFIYYPEYKRVFKFIFLSKNFVCDSVKLIYRINIDSSYVRDKEMEVCSQGFIIADHDTIYNSVINDFSLLTNGDALKLFISPTKGIVGWSSQLKDGSVISYGGKIYSDTINTIEYKRKTIQ